MVTYSQIDEDFNDGDLSEWIGDLDKFIVNEDFRLQLSDSQEGTATLYRNNTYGDSTSWTIDVELEFSPSTSNSLQLWLAVDNINIDDANGYILEIGETGSNDAIRLIELIDGNETTIATGIMGNVADPFDLTVELSIDSKDVWTLKTKPVEDLIFTQEFSVEYVPQVDFSSLDIFGINCRYTSTRIDQFLFDNIIVKNLEADDTAPQVVNVEIINADQIRITFDEAISEDSAVDISNYSFTPALSIADIEIQDNSPNIIILTLGENLPSGQLIEFNINGVADIAGNMISPTSFELRLTEGIEVGDLLVNEILFDPFPNGEDFVEVVNVSSKFLNLRGLIIENNTNQQSEIIEEDIILLPMEIIAFSENIDFLVDTYEPVATAILYEQDLPAFNNDDGNVTLKISDGQDIILDSYDYDDNDHLSIISDTEGISLERLSLTAETNNPSNWTSASEVSNFATPGYANSNTALPSSSEEAISLTNKVFSPNNDGNKDNLLINYNLDKPGFIANITIYDDKGRAEVPLVENTLLSTQGFFRWDGSNENGTLSPVGMYIIYYEFFHSDGDIIKGKEVCVLGQALD